MEGAKTRAAGRFRPLRRLSDDDLTAAVAAGDQRAFGVVFERYHAPLYRYCAGILRDAELAADALQNTMLAAMRGLKSEERSIALRPWLYRIAHNESISLLRGRPTDERLSEDALARLGVAPEVDGPTRARLMELLSDMRDLPEQQRAALLRRELNGLEYEEVGAALDITSNAARQAVFKARRSLQAVDAGRSATCDAMQTEMSANDRRFQRRRDIRAHLEGCADCRAFAAALTQRPRDLQVLFSLPAGVAAAVLGAGREAIGDDGERDRERRRHRALVALLVLGVAMASTAAFAALGGFDSGGGGGGGGGGRGSAPTPVQVSPGGASGSKGATPGARGGATHHKKHRQRPVRVAATSAVSAYSTSGELTENTVARSARSGGGLPLTGLAVGAVLATALALLAGGVALRRLAGTR